jgi:hypothetical protein
LNSDRDMGSYNRKLKAEALVRYVADNTMNRSERVWHICDITGRREGGVRE